MRVWELCLSRERLAVTAQIKRDVGCSKASETLITCPCSLGKGDAYCLSQMLACTTNTKGLGQRG